MVRQFEYVRPDVHCGAERLRAVDFEVAQQEEAYRIGAGLPRTGHEDDLGRVVVLAGAVAVGRMQPAPLGSVDVANVTRLGDGHAGA